MNRIMKDMVSIIEVGCGVVWDEIKGISTSLYRVFKNDNKSHVNKSKLNHRINPMQDPNGLSRLTTGNYIKEGHDMGGSYQYDDMIYDSNQNEDNTNVEDEDGVDENDWRDRFTGWLP